MISDCVLPSNRARERFFLLGLDIPEGIFDPRAAHLVTPNGRKTTWNFRGGADFLAKNQGNEKSTDDKPCGVPGFGIVERTFRSGHFGPAAEAVSEEFDENDGAVTGDTKTSFKGGSTIRRILSLRRVIDAIRMGLPEKSLGVFCNKRCRPNELLLPTVRSLKRLVNVRQIKT